MRARQMFAHGPALALLFVLAAFPSLYHGIERSYLANVDMDLISIYQAISVLSGLPLDPNPHTGYFYNVVLAGWLQLFHWLDLVPTVDMTALRTAPDFEARLAALTVAGRWFSIFQAGILAGLVYAGALMLNGDRRTALVLAIVFTIGGGGLAAQSVQLRTELPSMVLVVGAALLLIRATTASYGWALVMLGLVGFMVHAAMTTKIQAFALIAFLPLFPLVAAWRKRHTPPPAPDMRLTTGTIIVAAGVVGAAAIYLLPALMRESLGLYQMTIAVFAALCAGLYGYWRLGAIRHGIAGMSAIAIGSVAFLGLQFWVPDPWTSCVVFNFVEHGSVFAGNPEAKPAAQLSESVVAAAPGAASETAAAVSYNYQRLATRFVEFVIERTTGLDYPFAVVILLTAVAIAVLIVKRRWNDAVMAAFLFGIAVATVVAFWVSRGEFLFFYTVYVEAWVILACAVALSALLPAVTDSPTAARRLSVPVLILLSGALIATNVNNRLMDPGAATTRAPWNVCVIVVWAPLFGEQFKPFCENQIKRHADLAVNYPHNAGIIDRLLAGDTGPRNYPGDLRVETTPSVGECVLHYPTR